MVVGEPKRSIMEGIENTGDVRLHDHRLRLKQRFDIIRKLGQGTYGKVQLGINKKTSQEVAIKTIKKCKIETEADLIRIRREVQIMSSVRHPNIVHIYEVFENSEKMILVMEYCSGGELYDYLSQQKVLQEDEARRLFRQIATAVYYCHKHKICHRDLKLENVLLDENGNAKIADFGLSNVFEERRLLSTFCGSPLYASPEIVKGTPYIGPEVDCWSLGVLLYTLVYGAMPFDGSNFKRLVKQISTGDYFEPKTPSSASPLIRDMLTVDPLQRAYITHICDNPWVNKGFDVSCLELAEALANETPVRLDLLLSLAPPPPHGSDKLVVTDEATNAGLEGSPGHSTSMANIDNSAERRILEMVAEGGTDAIKPSPTRTIVGVEQPKRKLETTVSMDNAAGQRKKERFVRSNSNVNQIPSQTSEDVVALSSIENNIQPSEVKRDVSMCEQNKSDLFIEISKENEDKPKETEESVGIVKDLSVEAISHINTLPVADDTSGGQASPPSPSKSPVNTKKDSKADHKTRDSVLKEKNYASKPSVAIKKKVNALTSKSDEKKCFKLKDKSPPRKSIEQDIASTKISLGEEDSAKSQVTSVKQPAERRRSRILDAAEKLNSLSIQPALPPPPPVSTPPLPKPKKVLIPGVSVGSFKEQFERRASLTSGNVPSIAELKKTQNKIVQGNAGTPVTKSLADKKMRSVDSEHPVAVNNKESTNIKLQSIGVEPSQQENTVTLALQPKKLPLAEMNNKVTKPLHKSESLKEPSPRKDSLHNSLSLEDARRSLQQSMALLSQAKNDYQQSKSVEDNSTGENERQKQLKVAREIISNAIGDDNGKKVHRICMGGKPPMPYGSGGRSASGSLSLGSPPTSPPHQAPPPPPTACTPPRTFRTEVQHRVDDVRNKFLPTSRGGSVERIIPIHVASEVPKVQNSSNTHTTQLPYQRNKTMPYRLSSIPRGNVTPAEVERESRPFTPSTSVEIPKAEPIKKSPREFIIPIAVEGVGYVTPRQGSLEPSETPTKMPSSNISFSSRFPKPRRLTSLVSGGESEDEDDLHMHRLRSSRRVRADPEKDSISSGEEDDDEGFELLTAENLFSTLLDRVRSLTNRLNGEEGTGFPQHHQSLFNNLHSPFFNSPHLPRKHKKQNIIREGPSWRRSTSRDIASDFDSMFPSHTTFPRGSKRRSRKTTLANGKPPSQPSTSIDKADSSLEHNNTFNHNPETLDLSDLDLSKMELSEKEMEALSGLTPALSRRLQQQLLDHLPPAAARSLRRTLSAHLPPTSHPPTPHPYMRSLSATKTAQQQMPESNESSITTNDNEMNVSKQTVSTQKSTPLNGEGENSMSYNPFRCDQERETNISADYLSRDNSSHSVDIVAGKHDSLSLTPRPASAGSQTPDRSVLSKYFSNDRAFADDCPSLRSNYEQGSLLMEPNYAATYGTGCSILSGIPTGGSLKRHSLRTPPAETPRRRISRFLRPDFFDTPREESVYLRDKKDKELETQKVLKEIRQKRYRIGDVSSPNSPSASTDISNMFEAKVVCRNSLSPVGGPISRDKSRSVTPFYPILDNISECRTTDQLLDTKVKDTSTIVEKNVDHSNYTNNNIMNSGYAKVHAPTQNTPAPPSSNTCSENTPVRESRLVRPKSFPTKTREEDSFDITKKIENPSINVLANNYSPKDTKMLRPKSYPNSSHPSKSYPNSSHPSENVIPVKESGSVKSSSVENAQSGISKSTQNDSLDQNISVSFNICLPTKQTNKPHVVKSDQSANTEYPSSQEFSKNKCNLQKEPNRDKMLFTNFLPEKGHKNNTNLLPGESAIVGNQILQPSEAPISQVDISTEQNKMIEQKTENIPEKKIPETETTLIPDVIASDLCQGKSTVEKENNILTPEKSTSEQTEKTASDEKKKKSLIKKKIVVKKKVSVKKSDSSLDNQLKNNAEQKTDCKELVNVKNQKTDEKISPAKKKSVLHSIGEKFERFRNDSFNKSCSQEKESINDIKMKPQSPVVEEETKSSRIENVMRALRERSVPSGNMSEPTTESGLIKRAVTVTDLPTMDTKISHSKKSVNRVLGLFKKIETKDKNTKTEIVESASTKVENEALTLPANNAVSKNMKNQLSDNKPKRPTSLLLNGIGKRVQACYNGAASDSVLAKENKKSHSKPEDATPEIDEKIEEPKSQKKSLRLDFSRLPKLNQGIFTKRTSLDLTRSREGSECKEDENNHNWESENSHETYIHDVSKTPNSDDNKTDENFEINSNNLSSNDTLISPNWSPDYDTTKYIIHQPQQEADYNHNCAQYPQRCHEATSPDPENIVDRIRRKSFYSRFNEKKNRRKSQLVGPGAKEYIPSERIHPPVDQDNSYHNKYDYTVCNSRYEKPQTLEYAKLSHQMGSGECNSPTKYKANNSFENEPSAGSYKSLDRNDGRYLLNPHYQQYSSTRYPRTVSLFDNYEAKPPPTEYKNCSSRYGRSFSLLSPTSYSTASPRAHSRNSAIFLSGDAEPITESVLTKIRNRKKLAAMSPTMDDEDTYLDTKIRSNHTSNNEYDKSADQAE